MACWASVREYRALRRSSSPFSRAVFSLASADTISGLGRAATTYGGVSSPCQRRRSAVVVVYDVNQRLVAFCQNPDVLCTGHNLGYDRQHVPDHARFGRLGH